MSEFKVGDRVVGFRIVDRESHIDGCVVLARADETHCPVQTLVPDSPALIPVARWLAETPDAARHLRYVRNVAAGHHEHESLPSELQAAMECVRALIAALEEGTR